MFLGNRTALDYQQRLVFRQRWGGKALSTYSGWETLTRTVG